MGEVIYRKYRPKDFKSVYGQDHITNALIGAIKADRVAHAYLFSGPRGTGKTSVARILANDIGCHEYDLTEMDAASYRGIDPIRDLRDGVHTMPLKGKYKVYIIDEVHMLTKEAFNALLKTLEEPPGHAVFILATTEPEKLPDTIVSRCQHFSFKKIPEAILRESVKSITKKEGFGIDEEAAALVALFADGSFRDAQVMLDQLLAIGDKNKDKKISAEEARQLLSAPSKELIQNFVSSLIEKDVEKGMEIIQKITEKGIGVQMFLKFVLRNIRALLMLKLSPVSEKQLVGVLGEDGLEFLKNKLEDTTVPDLGFVLVQLLEAYDKTNRSYLPQLPLELALAKIHLREQNSKK
ncbi:MAG: DNA polymerase III subunit gamma/tau [Candidatus Marinimicrobia bacterium]|nr:DNA polymerase III subunit gamma/tau [Candidatus Neomarinimicrobiota bacterium]